MSAVREQSTRYSNDRIQGKFSSEDLFILDQKISRKNPFLQMIRMEHNTDLGNI